MNWKYLSLVALLGLSLAACEGKKEEKKADEAAPAETTKVEEHKAEDAKPAEAPKEEPKEEHKAS